MIWWWQYLFQTSSIIGDYCVGHLLSMCFTLLEFLLMKVDMPKIWQYDTKKP